MMSVRILRWKGGYGGDLIMYLMYLSGYNIANVKFRNRIDQNGRVMVDFDHSNRILTEIEKMALDRAVVETIDDGKLLAEISRLDQVWLKSHYYTSLYDQMTTDIVVDPVSLPFVLRANILKTDTMVNQDFHPLAPHVDDPAVKIKLAFYNVAVDIIDTVTASSFQIPVSTITAGWQLLDRNLRRIGLEINESARQFYETWLENNRHHLAGQTYVDMVRTQDYDWTHKDLSLEERYALLALGRERFKILHDNHT